MAALILSGTIISGDTTTKIKIDFENKQTSFIPKTYSVTYANGELLHMNDKGFVPKPSVPKNLECQWTADKNLYTGYFYFDEQEIYLCL